MTIWVIVMGTDPAFSQLAEYSFTGASGTPTSFAPDTQPEDGTLSDISRGSGINPASATNTFSANNWPLVAEGFDQDAYYSFTIQANTAFELTLSSIELDERRTSTGIRDWSIRSSLDNFTTDLATFNVPDNDDTRPDQLINLPSEFSNLSNAVSLEFRIYAFNAEGNSGSWRLDNIQLFGSIAPPDTQPPVLLSALATSSTGVLIEFDEGLDKNSSESVSNYLLNNSIQPISAWQQTDLSQVKLEFSQEFQDGVANTLVASNIEDLAGNSLTSGTINFNYTLVSPAQAGDIVINEIMADPTPVIGQPDAEYVELYNISSRNIDLREYTLSGDVITDEEFILHKGEYLILTDDSNTGLFSNVIELSSMGALTNSGETITLKDEINDIIIDEVSYEDDWYRDTAKDDGGYSLERIGAVTACGEALSWKVSEDSSGGTPGEINSVNGQEITPPELFLENYQITNDNTLTLEFSTSLLVGVIDDAEISIDDLIINAITPEQGTTFDVSFTDNFEAGIIYSLTIDSLANCDGSFTDNITLSFGEGARPGYNDLLITEIMANPIEEAVLPEAEYLELFNTTDKTITIGGIVLSDATSSTTLSDALIAPQEYLILTPNSAVSSLSAFGRVLGVSNWPSLNNSGDLMTLSLEDEIVFSINYSDSWYKDSEKQDGGFSLEMIDVRNPCGRIENWTASDADTGGTPGMVNSASMDNPDNFGPVIHDVFGEDKSILISFNEKIDPQSVASALTNLKPEIEITNKSLVRPLDDQLRLELASSLTSRTTYRLKIDNLTDCLGNPISQEGNTYDFNIPEEVEELDVVINEILFNPRVDGVDFVEILNRSDKHLNLKDWGIANLEDAEVVNLVNLTEDNLIIKPGDIIALTQDPTTTALQYPSSEGRTFIITDLPSFPNEEGSVALISDEGMLIDAFLYSEDLHLQLLNDFDGVSLERVSSEEPTQNNDNWKSAASTVGFATPGLPNSQTRFTSSPESSISVEPRIISPDNNGTNDFTTITYSLGSGNNIVTATVFDAQGRSIKKLLNNATIPQQGFVTWDGTNEAFLKVRTGYYVVLFEVFETNGNTRVFKERVVVGNGF